MGEKLGPLNCGGTQRTFSKTLRRISEIKRKSVIG
jgi:hypothetical protein